MIEMRSLSAEVVPMAQQDPQSGGRGVEGGQWLQEGTWLQHAECTVMAIVSSDHPVSNVLVTVETLHVMPGSGRVQILWAEPRPLKWKILLFI